MKKIHISLSLLFVLSAFSCQGVDNGNQIQDIDETINVLNNEIIVGNVSDNGAKISVLMNIDNSFGTKATADGTAPKKITDISHIKLYLTDSNTDPLNAANLKFNSSVIAYTGGVSQKFSFSNVPPGGPYFVAVELFDAATGLSTDNIIEPVIYGGTTGTKGLTVSSGTVPSVTVDNDNKVSHNNALTISPILKAGVGATIDANVAPQNGASTNTGITVN